MPATQQVKCRCGKIFKARIADIARGWGKFCSKSCKARAQEEQTHQHRNFKRRQRTQYYAQEYGGNPQFDRSGNYIGFTGIDHDHDCNKD